MFDSLPPTPPPEGPPAPTAPPQGMPPAGPPAPVADPPISPVPVSPVPVGAQPEQVIEASVPEGAWKRVHPITPLLNTWQVLGIMALLLLLSGFEVLAMALTSLRYQLTSEVLLPFGIVAAVLLLAAGLSYLSWWMTSYAVTDQAVWMRSGILFRKAKHVRLERIQAVDVVQPLLGRLFGMGTLTVEAAGGAGSSVQIGYLRRADMQNLRADIMARAGAPALPGPAAPSPPGPATQAAAVPPPEDTIYSVPAGRLLGAALTSPSVVGVILVFAVLSAVSIGISGLARIPVAPIFLAAAPVLLVVFIVTFQSRFVSDYNFRVAVSPDGIRVRRGLLETRSETIPPRRIHAVRVSQPLLWRLFGWYRVDFTQATQRIPQSGTSVASSTLLPVGSWAEAMMAVWLIIPDLGVEDPTRTFTEAVVGTARIPGFQGISRKAALFNPLTYNRKGLMVTHTCLISRDGRLNRSATFVPHERVQSVAVKAGPVDRLLGMANLTDCLVPGIVSQTVPHLPAGKIAKLVPEILARSKQSREAEPPERWFARVRNKNAATTQARTPNPTSVGLPSPSHQPGSPSYQPGSPSYQPGSPPDQSRFRPPHSQPPPEGQNGYDH